MDKDLQISFRELCEDDFPVLLEWLQRPHIKDFWDDGDDTLEKVRRHYTRDREATKRFILVVRRPGEESDSLAGYFQYYTIDSYTVGIDQFLAHESDLNRGIGSAAIRSFIAHISNSLSTLRYVVLDPEVRNQRAIRCYRKIGFRPETQRVEADGKEVLIMRLEVVAGEP